MTYSELYEKFPFLKQVERQEIDGRRLVHSYELRGQKLKEFQINALENYFDKYAIRYNNSKKLNYLDLFGNNNPVVIEIGFGMGDSTLKIAKDNPNINYIGIEVFLYGFSKLLSSIASEEIPNLKIIRFDAVQVLEDMIEDESVYGFHIFFPDPWPKTRHHKKRLIQLPFTNLLSSKLKKGGYVYCVTDWQDYADQMLVVLNETNNLVNSYESFAEPASWRPLTSFESKGLSKDYKINELWFTKG